MWLKEIAPSAELRHWFDHRAERWDEFRQRYQHERHDNEELIRLLRELLRPSRVTLVYAAKEERYNDAVALREHLPVKHA